MKWLKEPLLHFLLIGAVLFVLFGLASGGISGDADDEIVVSSGRIEQLANIFAKTWQRPPTREELQGLVDDFVLEEVYYRQAVAMGIDRDDTIIRRRLRQKLEFLTDDAAALTEPTEEELAAYLAANKDAFRRQSTYTFEQVYINPERHGDGLEDFVATQLAALRAGRLPAGGIGLLPPSFEDAPRQQVDGSFGSGFSGLLDGLSLPSEAPLRGDANWQGPIESGLGLHLIRLTSRTEGTLPELAEIRPVVKRELANERRLENRRRMNEQLVAAYDVTVEWPQAPAASQVPSGGIGGGNAGGAP